MRVRSVVRSLLFVVLLLLAVGPGLARGPEPTKPSEATDANASKAANAPWVTLEIDTPGDTGHYASVAIRPSDGQTFAGYYDASSQLLRLAYPMGFGGSCGPNDSWNCETWDSGVDVESSSIAINPQNGAVGFAYHDPLNDYLEYRTDGYSTVVDKKETVSESTGEYASLKYWGNGKPFIAYHLNDASGVDSLKVAYRVYDSSGNCGYDVIGDVTGDWQCDTIQTGEGVGQHASLVLDGDGFVHIAYYDGANGDLWYATTRGATKNCGPGNSWFCYPVSSTNDVGKYASLYVDNANRFHIAYYDATSDDLKYAVDVGGGGNCGVLGSAQCDTIDSMQADYHPLGVSVAEDAAGYPIIAYQSDDGDLNVARPLGALGLPPGAGNCAPGDVFYSWYCQTIDPHGQWVTYRNGDFVSIAVSPSGLATIAYYGFITSSGGNLMVARQRFQFSLPLVLKNY
jgi:hypothetical protein